MRNTFRAAIAAILLVVTASGCQKAAFKYGDNVSFRASTTSIGTKADYSGAMSGTVERIDWEAGDKVHIACAEASYPPTGYAEYLVEDITTSGRYSNAKITVSPEDNPFGLQWGTGAHHFYAVYPSPIIGGVTKSQDGKDVSGEIPASQAVESFSGTAAAKVAKPAFDASMMMVAAKTVSADDAVRDVSLDFKPVTTAIQFTIVNKTGDELTTCKVELSSKTHPLSGPFTCDISTGGSTFTGTLDNCKTAGISFTDPVVTPVDGSLTFTIFLNPADDPDDLTLSIYEEATKKRYTYLKMADGTKIEFESGVKTFVSGILVPAGAVWKVVQKNNLLSWTDGTVKDIEL